MTINEFRSVGPPKFVQKKKDQISYLQNYCINKLFRSMSFYKKKKIFSIFRIFIFIPIRSINSIVIKMNSMEAISIITAIVICNKLLILSEFVYVINRLSPISHNFSFYFHVNTACVHVCCAQFAC